MRKQLLKDNLKSATLVKAGAESPNHIADNHLYIVAYFQIPNIPFQQEDPELIDQIIMEDGSYGDYLWSLAGEKMWEFSINDPYQLSFIAEEGYGEEIMTWQEQMGKEGKKYGYYDIPDSIKELIQNDMEAKAYYMNPKGWEDFDTEGFLSDEGLLVMYMS